MQHHSPSSIIDRGERGEGRGQNISGVGRPSDPGVNCRINFDFYPIPKVVTIESHTSKLQVHHSVLTDAC